MASESLKPRVALVVKRSAFDRADEQPHGRMHTLLEEGDPAVANVMASHGEHVATVAEVVQVLKDSGTEVVRIRRRRRDFDASAFDLVVTVGGDGTLLHASHSVGPTPVLAVNSAPSHSVGFFCGARKDNIRKVLATALKGSLPSASLARMQVSVNGEVVHARVLNDALFCHRSPGATSRYLVEFGETVEDQKSSGLWIGPAAGSTAAQRSAGGKVLPLTSNSLQMVVREPYTPHGERYLLAHVIAKRGQRLKLRSKSTSMRIYIDGLDDIVHIGLGDVIEFSLAPEPLNLLGISARRKWGQQAR